MAQVVRLVQLLPLESRHIGGIALPKPQESKCVFTVGWVLRPGTAWGIPNHPQLDHLSIETHETHGHLGITHCKKSLEKSINKQW